MAIKNLILYSILLEALPVIFLLFLTTWKLTHFEHFNRNIFWVALSLVISEVCCCGGLLKISLFSGLSRVFPTVWGILVCLDRSKEMRSPSPVQVQNDKSLIFVFVYKSFIGMDVFNRKRRSHCDWPVTWSIQSMLSPSCFLPMFSPMPRLSCHVPVS